MSLATRTVLFWLFIVALGIVLWRSVNKPAELGRALNLTEFLDQVDKNNVREVVISVAHDTAEAQGELREPAEKFHTTIPKELIPDLTRKLREKNVPMSVTGSSGSDWTTFVLNAAPLFLLVVFWIFMMRRMQRRKR